MALPARDVILRDGSTMRLVSPSAHDRAAIVEFFDRLSVESLYLRFQGIVPRNARLAERYLDADGSERAALVGLRNGQVVALGTFDRLRDHTAAEVAFAVDDRLQGQGIGTRLLEQLVELATAAGIERFVAVVSTENHRMLDVFTLAGFAVSRRVEPGTVELSFPIEATATYREQVDRRDHIAAVTSLAPFFRPRSVAVIGASSRPGGVGHSVVRNLLDAGFPGAVYPINLRGEPVAGIPAVRSADEIPGPVDLAVICVRADRVVETAEQVLQAEARALCVISAGFAESGETGRVRQERLLERVRMHGARLLGPNCLGIAVPGTQLNATFAPHAFPCGTIGFASQSGALGLALLGRVGQRGLGLSAFVSVGNKADISTNDLLEYWEEDEATRLVLLYVESFGNPRKFGRIAKRVARTKPVLAIKSGISRSGARAAGSHTAALAGSDTAVEALFHESGVLRLDTLEEVLDLAALLTDHPLPAGNRVGIVTNAGGLGILCADACERSGLALPAISGETGERLTALLPAEATVDNPVDMLGSASAESYRQIVPVLLADPALDALVILHAPAAVSNADDVAESVVAAASDATKPVLAVVMTESGVPGAFNRERSPVAAFTYPESAARALGRAVQRAMWLRRPKGIVRRPDDIARQTVASIQPVPDGGRWLGPAEARSMLVAYGLPVVAERLAETPRDAARAARDLGFPVVVKTAIPGVHKTERGEVALGLRDAAAVRAAAAAIGGAVVVQPMVSGGVELLAGIVQDPSFGPLVAFGAGGILAELIGDATYRIAPLTDVDTTEMIGAGKAGRLTAGFRGMPRADAEALADLLARLSALAVDFPELAELDLNPVIGRSDGCVIVDARARVLPATRAERLKTW
jgi:acetate---CoA ligase (ADP-forming)